MRHHPLFGLFILLVLTVCSSAAAAQTLEQEPPLLFAIATAASASDAAATRGERRWLVRPTSLPRNQGGTHTVRLPLGDHRSVVAHLQVVETLEDGGVALSGPIDGVPDGHASFVQRRHTLAGSIHLPSGSYTVAPARTGHVLEALPHDGVLRCAGPLRPLPPASGQAPRGKRDAAEAGHAFAAAASPVVDVLVVYTADAVAGAGGVEALKTTVEAGFLEMNTSLGNSQVDGRLRLALMYQLQYVESRDLSTDLQRLASRNDGLMDEVHAVRDQIGADLVALITEANDDGYAGMAFFAVSFGYDASAWGFSVTVRRYVTSYTLAHELGHNLGLHHDRDNANGQPLLPYGYGLKDPPHFRTVMSYPCPSAPCPRVPHFSNPRVTRAGRPTGREDSEDNARVLVQTLPIVAAYRRPPPPTLTSVEPASGSTLGGNVVLLRGTGFITTSEVTLDGEPGAIVEVTATHVSVRAPRHVAGPVHVSMAAEGGRADLPDGYTYLAGPADTDGDALPNEWEQRFGLDVLTADAGGAAGDPDGDGVPNADEFVRGGHPNGGWWQYFAEGATSTFFDTRFSFANPLAEAVVVAASFNLSDGSVRTSAFVVPPRARYTLRAADVEGLSAAEFSTTFEAAAPLAVDRLMEWSAEERYGSHLEQSTSRARSVWYLAEGATHSGFELFYLLQNPHAVPITVEVTFLRPEPAEPLIQHHVVGPHSRYNIWVDQIPELTNTDVSAVLRTLNGQGIIVERSMYLDAQGQSFGAGHSSMGVSETSARWYFAEGATGPYFDTFVLIANPEPHAVDVMATYLLPGGASLQRTHRVAPESRYNIWVDHDAPELADTAVSVVLETVDGTGIIAERAMWWAGPSATWFEAHVSAGAVAASSRWISSEGQQDATHDTYLLIANPQGVEATAKVTLLFEDRSPVTRTLVLPAKSRTNVAVGTDFPEAQGRRFGAVIEVQEPDMRVVVERALYSDAPGRQWAAGGGALATSSPTRLDVTVTTDPDGRLRLEGLAPWTAHAVEVNGIATAFTDGRFTFEGFALVKGDNILTLRALDARGRIEDERTIRVVWQPMADTAAAAAR